MRTALVGFGLGIAFLATNLEASVPAPTESATIVSVCMVTPSIMAVTVDEGHIEHRPLTAYFAQPDDQYIMTGPTVPPRLWRAAHLDSWAVKAQGFDGTARSYIFAHRGGQPFGWVVGPARKHLWPVQPLRKTVVAIDRIAPERFWLCRVGGVGEPRFPLRVTRKTRPHFKGATGPGYEGPLGRRHTIILDWGMERIEAGEYELNTDLGGLPRVIPARVDDAAVPSDSVHVNLAGYERGAPAKQGYFSYWMGDWGGAQWSPAEFEVCDAVSNRVVFRGRPRRRTAADGIEWRDPDGREFAQAGAPVWEMDFSDLVAPGMYVLRVPGVGISQRFEIRDGMWRDAFRLQALGLLHQRSGIELGPPFTKYRRPRNLHSLDGQVVLSCDEDAFWAHQLGPGESEANPFARIEVSAMPGTQNPEAWGSWSDAADHDRRYLHLEVAHVLLMLYEANPQFFDGLALALPPEEIGNGLPDIVDEVIWGLDLYRRTQRTDGAIIYGIEALQHPNRGEPSWLETLPVAVVPPTPDAAFTYAGAAARLARVLDRIAPDLAKEWAESAIRAHEWALANDGNDRYPEKYRSKPENRLMAVWQLQLLSPERRYESLLRNELDLAWSRWQRTPVGERALFQNLFPIIDLTLADRVPLDLEAMRSAWRGALLATADDLVSGASESAFGLLRKPGCGYFYWIVEAEGSAVLAAAHRLSGAPRYLNALISASHYGMGANPLNLAFTSGLGGRAITPMIGDAEFAQLGYPDGIPAYGPAVIPRGGLPHRAWGWDERRAAALRGTLWPEDITAWPLYETYFESIGLPVINEFTLHQGMSDQLLRWGYLAQYFGGGDVGLVDAVTNNGVPVLGDGVGVGN